MTLPDAQDNEGGSEPHWDHGRDFVVVHLDLVDALDGSYDAAALWHRIGYRAGTDGWWTASRADMQAELRMTEHRVRTALALLRERRMIRSQRVAPFDPTLQWRVWYRGEQTAPVTEPDADTVVEDSSGTVMEDSSGTTVLRERREPNPPQPPHGGSEGDPQPTLIDVDTPQEPAPSGALVAVPDDNGFDAFWAAYPRKVGKGAARKAWPKALAKVGGDVGEIAAGFRRALPAWQQRKARGEERFIPHPATWLNEERWHDDTPQPERVTSAAPGSVSMLVQQAQNAAAGNYVDPWEYAKGVAGPGHIGLDSPAPGHPALPARERNQR